MMKAEDPRITELRIQREKTYLGGGQDRIDTQHAKGKLTARERLEFLIDPGTFQELEPFITHAGDEMGIATEKYLGDGVITGYGAAVHTAKVEPGSTVAVVGCGGIGLAAVNGARIAGASRILAVDKDPAKLELAKTFGATDGVLVGEDTAKQIIEMTQGGVHYSFECIGLKQTTELCFAMLRPGGTATIIGMIPVGTKIELHGPDFLRERRIQGSMMGSNRFRVDMPRLIEFYQQGRLPLQHLVSGRLKLDQINEGFAALAKGGVARNVIVFDA
jgi:S-(hydroxymethyl)glutathione dehydrogenase/alcohol dehydrogenase